MSSQPPRPGDLSPDDFRRVGAAVIDAIANYHAGIDRRRVLPDVTPATVAARFADPMPEDGLSAEAIVADWGERVLPFLTTVGSPRHFGYVNGSGAMIGILADALAASVNTNAGAWKLGPAATEVERQTLRWIAGLTGYPVDCGGIVVSGGTMANFTALLAALRHVAPYDTTPAGLQHSGRSGRFLVYMSDHEGHVSITRAADLLNLGREAVRRVPSRPDLTMDPAALARMVAEDRARGDLPFCVVAQLGSINVGVVDPIDAIADVCRAEGLWLHGDGACGLMAAMLPETRALFAGLERADSLAVDPHKWLGVPYDCGVVLVRDPERLRRAFSISAPYLRGPQDTDAEVGLDFLERGPEMSRGFKALKLWMTLRFLGTRGLREVLEGSLRLTRHLHHLVREHPECEVLHEPVLYLYCFRYVPAALRDRSGEPAVEAELDRLNQAIAEAMQQSGLALVMTSRLRGRVVLRFSICSHRTRMEDIEETFGGLVAYGRLLSARVAG
jgi:glutamate/tyrosine decarboxylase-like PLP-dependent enzyme